MRSHAKCFSKSLRLLGAIAQLGLDLGPDVVDGGSAIDTFHDALGCVVVQDRHRLLLVAIQALGQGLGGVVRALHQLVARDVVLHRFRDRLAIRAQLHGLGRGILDMVGPARCLVDPTAADSLLQDGGVDVESHDEGDGLTRLGEHLVEGLGLRLGSREPIQDETRLAVIRLDAVSDDADDNLVADQSACSHHLLGLLANLGAGRHGLAKHVAGGELWDAEHLDNPGSLGALASTRGAKDHHDFSGPIGAVLLLDLRNLALSHEVGGKAASEQAAGEARTNRRGINVATGGFLLLRQGQSRTARRQRSAAHCAAGKAGPQGTSGHGSTSEHLKSKEDGRASG
mmetsp:Transcript_71769/g.156213  ORF Transcript_71769/g.156213 Transcript_71769/m.156213 type:complete len:342 (+) Transcript_71769:52-1077(+)